MEYFLRCDRAEKFKEADWMNLKHNFVRYAISQSEQDCANPACEKLGSAYYMQNVSSTTAFLVLTSPKKDIYTIEERRFTIEDDNSNVFLPEINWTHIRRFLALLKEKKFRDMGTRYPIDARQSSHSKRFLTTLSKRRNWLCLLTTTTSPLTWSPLNSESLPAE